MRKIWANGLGLAAGLSFVAGCLECGSLPPNVDKIIILFAITAICGIGRLALMQDTTNG